MQKRALKVIIEDLKFPKWFNSNKYKLLSSTPFYTQTNRTERKILYHIC